MPGLPSPRYQVPAPRQTCGRSLIRSGCRSSLATRVGGGTEVECDSPEVGWRSSADVGTFYQSSLVAGARSAPVGCPCLRGAGSQRRRRRDHQHSVCAGPAVDVRRRRRSRGPRERSAAAGRDACDGADARHHRRPDATGNGGRRPARSLGACLQGPQGRAAALRIRCRSGVPAHAQRTGLRAAAKRRRGRVRPPRVQS